MSFFTSIKKKNSANYLTRLDNHKIVVAVNLSDNNNSVNRLKLHSLVDLPFRF